MKPDSTLRIHHIEPASRVNGPGQRAVIWLQGCAFACPGCFNPETHDMHGGELWAVEKLADHILEMQSGIEGITISGGEPLYQHRALARMLARVRAASSLSVVVFTGYTWIALNRLKGIAGVLNHVDVLLAGRYNASQRVAHGLLGSSNKTIHFLSGRYGPKDLEKVPEAEIILSPDGEIFLSGIDPLKW